MSLIDDIEISNLSEATEILKGDIGCEELFEKARKIGDEKVYQGITYYVHALNSKGQPLWRKKKDGGASSSANTQSATQESGNAGSTKPAKKSKWKVGDTKQYQGVTWVCSGFNDKGGVKWRKAKQSDNSGNTTKTATNNITSTNQKPQTASSDFVLDKQRYTNQLGMAKKAIKLDGHTSNVKMGLFATQKEIEKIQEKLDNLRKKRPGAKRTIKIEEDKLNVFKTNEKALQDAIKEFESGVKQTKSDPPIAKTTYKKFAATFKLADDETLNKIISGKIQSTDQEKDFAKRLLNERKNKANAAQTAVNSGAKMDVSSAKKMMTELGDSTWWGLKNSDRPTNNYSYFVGISQGSGKAKGKLFVRLQGDTGNTDMTTSVPFEEFFKNGSYEGGRGIRTWSAEKKAEIMKALLKDYKERISPAGKKKAATEKQIEKITNIAFRYTGNELYTQYKRYLDISKYSTNEQLAKHDAYYNVDNHLKKWLRDNAAELVNKSDAEVKSAVAKEAKTFMDEYVKTFDAAKFRKQHALIW